jgi:hypothetical protein
MQHAAIEIDVLTCCHQSAHSCHSVECQHSLACVRPTQRFVVKLIISCQNSLLECVWLRQLMRVRACRNVLLLSCQLKAQ